VILVPAAARVLRRRRLRVRNRADLARLALASIGGPQVRGVSVLVAEEPLVRGWMGQPRIAGIRGLVLRPAGGGTRVIVDLDKANDLGLVLAAVLRLVQPTVPLALGAQLTLAPGLPLSGAALIPFADAVTDRGSGPSGHLRRDDLVIGPGSSIQTSSIQTSSIQTSSVQTLDGEVPTGTSYRELSASTWFVDPAIHRPIGRVSPVNEPVSATIVDAESSSLRVRLPGGNRQLQAPLTAADIAALLEVDVLPIEPTALAEPLRWQLQSSGVVLSTQPVGDPLELQSQSVLGRRAALQHWSPQAWLNRWPTVSAVMLTHRTEHLERIAAQLGALQYPRLEIILALHGLQISDPLVGQLHELAGRSGAHVRMVSIDGSLVFGAAMQQASRMADGELLTKVDDDDWYAPSHIWDLVLARSYSGAQVVGKALDWIALQDCTVFRPVYPAERYALFVAGGTMLISQADLQQVGGWRDVPRSIDRALLQQVRQEGGLVYRTHGLGYIYSRVGESHTARVSDAHFMKEVARTWPGIIRHESFGTQ